MILRNFLFKLLQNRPADEYHIGITVDGINTSDERNRIAEELVKRRCLKEGWHPVGRTGIQGHFFYDVIEELVKKGNVE